MMLPVMFKVQCGAQKYGNVPAVVKVCWYIAPALEVVPEEQFVSLGEQNLPSAVQAVPLVAV